MESPSRHDPPSTFLLEGGQVFCSGTAEIGLGTVGLGEKAKDSVKHLQDAHMREYWTQRAAVARSRDEKEYVRLQKIAAEQAMSPRRRLEMVMAAREDDIARMTKERKEQERKAKEEADRAAALKNARIHQDKELVARQLAEAKEQRKIQKERELALIRSKRQEMLAIQEEERHAEELASRAHITQLRQWHDVCKARALEEAQLRKEKKHEVVVTAKKEQKVKEKQHQEILRDIVDIKADLIKGVKRDITRALSTTMDKREDMLIEEAKRVKDGIKQRAKEREEKEKKRLGERAQSAKARKQDAAQRQKEYLEEKERKKELLQAQAKLQKAKAREAIELEKEEKKREHAEYVATMKDLISRSAKANQRSNSQTPHPFSH